MRFLRTNTAIRLTVGPFLDKTDGVTPETALTVTSCKLTLIVDDGNVPTLVIDANATASGGDNDLVHITGDDAGFYDLELTSGNLAYLGRAMLSITDAATHCPVFHEFMILPAMVYDSLVLGTDRFDANVTHIADTAQTARDIGASVLLSNGTGTGQVKIYNGYVAPDWGDIGRADTTVDLSATTVAVVNNMNSPAVTAIHAFDLNGYSAPAGSTADYIQTIKTKVNPLTYTVANQVDANALSGGGGLDAAGVRAAVGLASANLDTQLGAIDDYIDTEVAAIASDVSAIKTKTDQFVFTVANQVDANALSGGLDAAGVRAAVGLASANLDTQLDALPTNTDLATALGTADDAVLAQIALVKAQTDLIPADPADASDIAGAFSTVNSTLATIAGYIDTEVAAIKAKTDQLIFTTANQLDVQVLSVANNAITAASLAADAGTEIATAVLTLSNGVETGITLQQATRAIFATMAAKGTKVDNLDGTFTITWRDAGDTKDRIVADIDADGSRTTVTRDLT